MVTTLNMANLGPRGTRPAGGDSLQDPLVDTLSGVRPVEEPPTSDDLIRVLPLLQNYAVGPSTPVCAVFRMALGTLEPQIGVWRAQEAEMAASMHDRASRAHIRVQRAEMLLAAVCNLPHGTHPDVDALVSRAVSEFDAAHRELDAATLAKLGTGRA